MWLSRPSGTYCFRERDVFLKDTRQHNTWRFYGEQTRDHILAYAVTITGTAGGKIKGNLYELDYPQHFKHVAEQALPADTVTLHYERGSRTQPTTQRFDGYPDPQLGEFVRGETQPNDPDALRFLLQQEQRERERLKPGDFKEHTAALHDSRIRREAERVLSKLQDLKEPNSPDKTHFMVELSPHFTAIASSKDTDCLLSMLPFKKLSLSNLKERHGIYAFLPKDENRTRAYASPASQSGRSLPQTGKKPPRKRRRQNQNITIWRYEHEQIYH